MKATLLIADHNEGFRKKLSSLLSEHFEVVGVAKDGKEAIERVLISKPDLALFDVVLPKFSGIEAVRFLKEEGKSKTRFIILTELSTDTAVAEAWAAGVVDYLVKPFDSGKLIEVLLKHVEAESALREAGL